MNFPRDRRLEFGRETWGCPTGHVDHVTAEDHHRRNAKILVDPILILIPMLQNQPGIAAAGLGIAVTIPGQLRRALIPLPCLRPLAQDQRGFAERGEEPILARFPSERRHSLRVNFLGQRAGTIRFSAEQAHRRRVDPRPITARPLVSLRVGFGRALQKFFAFLPRGGVERKILVGPAEHAEGFFIGLPFAAQLFEHRIRRLARAAASERQTLQLPQANVRRMGDEPSLATSKASSGSPRRNIFSATARWRSGECAHCAASRPRQIAINFANSTPLPGRSNSPRSSDT